MLKIFDLRTENLDCPIGIEATSPRLSWKLSSERKNVIQKSYRIKAFCDCEKKELVWDSGKIESDKSICVEWEGPLLKSGQRIYWNVVVETIDGTNFLERAESECVFFEMGLLNLCDWKARWIEPEDRVDVDGRMPAPYLRKTFCVKSGLKRARIYQTAHGLYETWFNGILGTNEKFKPGFTSYYKRLQYQVSDITELLTEGKNCWSVMLGDGWWRGTTGGAYRNNFGYKLAYLGQIFLEYEDNTSELVITDESFLTSSGGLLQSDMKEGDVYDARLEPIGWKTTEFDDRAWKQVHFSDEYVETMGNLIGTSSVSVLEKEVFEPRVIRTPNGACVLDFGQNIAGYVSMKLHNLNKGQKVTLVHGEALDEAGNFTLKNLVIDKPDAKIQSIEYIGKGNAEEFYCPSFSVFGFQYVLIQGYEAEVIPGDFKAIAVYSALEETGKFKCSNSLINKLVDNSRWSQKGNFLDVPTDCPTRERSAWSGDSQIYAKTASYFMNVYPFFEKWMKDASADQFASGKIPNTIPLSAAIHNPKELARKMAMIDMLPDQGMTKLILKMTLGTIEEGGIVDGSAGWGDMAVIVPYMMYLCYGDKKILENQYDSAKKWVDYVIQEAEKQNDTYIENPWYQNPEESKYIWDTGFHFGEWLEPDIHKDNPFMELLQYPDYNTATMYYYYSAKLLSEIAEVLGYAEDQKKYREISECVKRIFNKYFILPDGTIKEGRQAPNVRALAMGLVDDSKKKAVAGKLAEMIRDNGYKLNTGFLATSYLLPVLVDNGYEKEAFKVLEQTESPSWLYNVLAGATTILEDWDGFKKCKNSFNHYSYGAVCNFLFEYVAGIRPLWKTPGYKKFMLKPISGGSLNYVEAVYESGYGTIYSSWKKKENGIEYTFEIPANATAVVEIGAESCVLGSGKWSFETTYVEAS